MSIQNKPSYRTLLDAGFVDLAATVHLATEWQQPGSPYFPYRCLQTEYNFPFLFLASILLHRMVKRHDVDRVLMCSRDAWMWEKLQRSVRHLDFASSYDVQYFYTSRLTRWFPSESVLEYTRMSISGKTLIVDLCGSGLSLSHFAKMMEVPIRLFILVGYLSLDGISLSRVPYCLVKKDNTAVELANLANHPMVEDISHCVDGSFRPIFANPTGFQWHTHPCLRAMHDAFDEALRAMNKFDYSVDLSIDEKRLISCLSYFYNEIEASDGLLKQELQSIFGAEEGYTRQSLNNKSTLLGRRPIYLVGG
jgi:hypothetical protein